MRRRETRWKTRLVSASDLAPYLNKKERGKPWVVSTILPNGALRYLVVLYRSVMVRSK